MCRLEGQSDLSLLLWCDIGQLSLLWTLVFHCAFANDHQEKSKTCCSQAKGPSAVFKVYIVKTLCCSSETHHSQCYVSSVCCLFCRLSQIYSELTNCFAFEFGRIASEIFFFFRAETWACRSTRSCLLMHCRTAMQLYTSLASFPFKRSLFVISLVYCMCVVLT